MICALFAVADNGAIGYQGTMPWPRNKQDMMWFKKLTQNNTVVMGKSTWESTDMPIPLPNRTNVLITNNFVDREDILQLRGDVCSGLIHLQNEHNMDKIFVIGGANILMQALPVIDKAYITRIKGEFIHDTRIEMDDFLVDFELIETNDLGTCIVEEYNRCNNT
jgi:dihydrofolate reductase